jgi:hypothetical protein
MLLSTVNRDVELNCINKLWQLVPSGSGLEDIKLAIQQLTMQSHTSTSTYSSLSGSESSEPAMRRLMRHSSLETINTNVTSTDEFVWVDSHNRYVAYMYLFLSLSFASALKLRESRSWIFLTNKIRLLFLVLCHSSSICRSMEKENTSVWILACRVCTSVCHSFLQACRVTALTVVKPWCAEGYTEWQTQRTHGTDLHGDNTTPVIPPSAGASEGWKGGAASGVLPWDV